MSEATRSNGALSGLPVVALEQAVVARFRTSRLADAGASGIKIERENGDLTREYDEVTHGESAYFVWHYRGKQALALAIKTPDDAALPRRALKRADVLGQNLAPDAAERAGFGAAALRRPCLRRRRAVHCFDPDRDRLDQPLPPRAQPPRHDRRSPFFNQ